MKLVRAIFPYNEKAFEMLKDFKDTAINAICEGITGQLWVDDEKNPRIVLGKYRDFRYLYGKFQKIENLEEILMSGCDCPVLVTNDEMWAKNLRPEITVKETTRYRLDSPEKFDEEALTEIWEKIKNYPQLELRIMNGEDYDGYDPTGWEHDMRGCYKSKEEFLAKSCGVVVVCDGEVVSGCSAYTYYSKGVEVQIETLEKYRGMGLGMIVGARYMLECQKRGLKPNWDAAHLQSAKMAQRLGFKLAGEYKAFELKKEG